MHTIKELRQQTGLSQNAFGEFMFGIPVRTIQDWESGRRKCPDYVLKLIEFKIMSEKKEKEEVTP